MKVWDIQYIHLKQISSSQIKLKRRTLLGGEKDMSEERNKIKKNMSEEKKEIKEKISVWGEKKSKKNLRVGSSLILFARPSVQAYICLITLPCQDLSINAFQSSSLLWSLIQGLVRLILHIDMISRLKNQSIFTRESRPKWVFPKLKVFGAQRIATRFRHHRSLRVCKKRCRGEITTGLWDFGADSQKLCRFYETFQSANICAQAVAYLKI